MAVPDLVADPPGCPYYDASMAILRATSSNRGAPKWNGCFAGEAQCPPRTVAVLLLGQLAVVLGEEPGWRGFALPRLEHFGRIFGTLVLGIGWAVWHLPVFLIRGTAQYGTAFIPFLILLTAWSMVMTVLVVRARGGIIGAMLFHASANLCSFAMWEPDSAPFALSPWVIVAAIAAWRMQAECRTPVSE